MKEGLPFDLNVADAYLNLAGISANYHGYRMAAKNMFKAKKHIESELSLDYSEFRLNERKQRAEMQRKIVARYNSIAEKCTAQGEPIASIIATIPHFENPKTLEEIIKPFLEKVLPPPEKQYSPT